MRRVNPLLLFAILLGVTFGATHFLSATANAQTQTQADRCRTEYGGNEYKSGSTGLKKFNNSNCSKQNGGNCTASNKVGPNQPLKVECTKKPAASSASTTAGNVSASCSDDNDICVKSLPRVDSDGSFIQTVLRIVIGIIAAISILFVAIGGLRYVLSQGDPQGVSKAKSTIIYALIGLVVALLAQGIILFVLKVVS